jgi:hypothetical protein
MADCPCGRERSSFLGHNSTIEDTMKLNIKTEGLDLDDICEKLKKQFPEYRYTTFGRTISFRCIYVRKSFFVRVAIYLKKDGIDLVPVSPCLGGLVFFPLVYLDAREVMYRLVPYLRKIYGK